MNGTILIFSDTHLTTKYDRKKFELLSKLIGSSDRVIINGDFYEGYVINFGQFIASPWRNLFPLLKEKKAIYSRIKPPTLVGGTPKVSSKIYPKGVSTIPPAGYAGKIETTGFQPVVDHLFGNHDKQLSDQEYEMFCDQAMEKVDFNQNGVTFHLFHGHGVDRTFDVRHPNIPRFIAGIISRTEKVVCRVFGRRYLALFKPENEILKRWKAKNLPANDWLICGHTHLAELDEKTKFANLGLFLSEKLASYLIIEQGKINLHYVNG